MPPTIIFLDLDGCLVDSTAAVAACLRRALSATGLDPEQADVLTPLLGPPLAERFPELLDRFGADPHLAVCCAEHYRDCYVHTAPARTVVVEGIPEALDRLRAVSSLVVVTAKPRAFALPILQATGLATRLTAVRGPAPNAPGERKTTILARALDDLAAGLPPTSTAMVGDRHHDIEAGRACGTITVGVTWGTATRAELADAGADHLVDRPAELVKALGA